MLTSSFTCWLLAASASAAAWSPRFATSSRDAQLTASTNPQVPSGAPGAIPHGSGYLAPLHNQDGADFIAGEYIVVLQPNSTVEDHFESLGTNFLQTGHALAVYTTLPGYHARFDNETQLFEVRSDPHVQFVQPNSVRQVRYSNITHTPHDDDSSLHKRQWIALRQNPGWGSYALPMMTTRPGQKLKTPVANDDPNNGFFQYSSATASPGQGVDIYILDTGIKLDHPSFGGRATNFAKSFCGTEPPDDVGNHGTAVASCAAGASLGTGQAASLINVKVLCGDGKLTDNAILAALDAVTLDHNSKSSAAGFKGSIINMSHVFASTFESQDFC
jgi:subtilisin family serine protease